MGLRFRGGFNPGIYFRSRYFSPQIYWQTEGPFVGTLTQSTSGSFSATSPGVDAVEFSVASGTFPPGLNLVGGSFSGTPTVPGNYVFSMAAITPYRTVEKEFAFNVNALAPGNSQIITNGSSPTTLNSWSHNGVGTPSGYFLLNSSYWLQQTTNTTTTKADYGKTYSVRVAYRNAEFDSNPVNLSWSVVSNGATLTSGSRTTPNNGSTIQIATFVGTDYPITFRITNNYHQGLRVYVIEIVRTN